MGVFNGLRKDGGRVKQIYGAIDIRSRICQEQKLCSNMVVFQSNWHNALSPS